MKIFSPTLKRQMKDCILSIFWPKKDIINFFSDCAVPSQITTTLETKSKQPDCSRSKIIDLAFVELQKRPDNGHMHFDLMLEALANWTHFDNYWFNEQQKLNLPDAKSKISQLRSAKSRDIDLAKDRAAREKKKKETIEKNLASMSEMREEFQEIATSSTTAQNRGHSFEKLITKMAKFYNLKVTEGFRSNGAQIDGSIKFDGENYTIEAKWHDRAASNEPLMAFCHKQEMNMHGRGIFISVNGYTEGALSMLERSNIKNAVLFDGEDIMFILSEMITFPEALDKKVHAAQTQGKFYINPLTGKSKI